MSTKAAGGGGEAAATVKGITILDLLKRCNDIKDTFKNDLGDVYSEYEKFKKDIANMKKKKQNYQKNY